MLNGNSGFPKYTDNAVEKPNSKHAAIAHWGLHLPNITAAIAIYPWPDINVGLNEETTAKLIDAPPNPANIPDIITAAYLVLVTLIPNVSAAPGCSPTALILSPNLVLYNTYHVTATNINAMKTVAYALNIVSNILPDGNKPFNGLGIFVPLVLLVS